MKPIVYVCNEPGIITEKGPEEYGCTNGFLVVKKYPALYAENLSRFNCPRQIYGVPFGIVPNKTYLGTDRDVENEYSPNLKQIISPEERNLTNQLERSGTSIGANIREAKYAHGKADFIAKLQISLKECYETEYWLELAQKAEIVSEESVKSLLHDCGAIRRMLIASINTTKDNLNKSE